MSDIQQLRWKVFGGMGAIGLLLLFVMGYNMGSLAEDNRLEVIEGYGKRVVSLMEKRYQTCEARRMAARSGVTSQESDNSLLTSAIDSTQKQKEVSAHLIKEQTKRHDACQDKLVKLRSSVSEQALGIERLREEVTNFSLALKVPQTRHKQSLKVLKGYIRALRLENEAIVKRIEAKRVIQDRAEERRKAEEKLREEQAQETRNLRAKQKELAPAKEIIDPTVNELLGSDDSEEGATTTRKKAKAKTSISDYDGDSEDRTPVKKSKRLTEKAATTPSDEEGTKTSNATTTEVKTEKPAASNKSAEEPEAKKSATEKPAPTAVAEAAEGKNASVNATATTTTTSASSTSSGEADSKKSDAATAASPKSPPSEKNATGEAPEKQSS